MDFFDFSNPGDMTKNIREMVRCPFCGSEYSEKNIKVIGRFGKNHVLQLVCRHCANSIMANISYRGGEEDIIGINEKKPLDMEFTEMVNFVEKGPVNENDVMDFYKAIKEFDGDFTKVFGTNQIKSRRTKKI